MTTIPTSASAEELEGLGDSDDSSWGEYPIDTVLIRTEPRTVFEILRRIEKGSFVMDPDFQRDFIWPEEVQSKLIESVLMRIPLPVFYLAEDSEGRMVVVDGLQRLSTFQRFCTGKLPLKLPGQSELDGKRFDELAPKLQNRIEDCNLTLYIIDAKVHERARLDIFERVNSGAPLTRQQMRNCLYSGASTRFLKEEAGTDVFREATGGSINIKTMRDREFVNRFCAFQLLEIELYKGDMDDFLALALTEMNKKSTSELERLSQQFRDSLANNYSIFDNHAFRKHKKPDDRRSVLNASLWDVMSTGLASYSVSDVARCAASSRAGFYRLMCDKEFVDVITYGPNDARKVKRRFAMARAMFEEVFRADAT
ncbi:MAG: DUF262 domain-containing protein [Planctomycetota bacterium]